MAKSALTIIIAASFIGLAVFGFMDGFYGGGVHRPGCIASRAMQTSCPDGNMFASLAFHLDALRWFSTAQVNGTAVLLTLFITVAAGVAMFVKPPVLIVAGGMPVAQHASFRKTPYPATRKFIGWLSLRERRDPASRI